MVLCAMAFCGLSCVNDVHAEAKQSTLTVDMTQGILAISLTPSGDGTFGKSSDSTIGIRTDNYTGYSMSIVSPGSTSLVNAGGYRSVGHGTHAVVGPGTVADALVGRCRQ